MSKTAEFIDVVLKNKVHRVEDTVIPFYNEFINEIDIVQVESEILLYAFENSYTEFIYWFTGIKSDVNLSINDEEPFRLSCEGDALELVEFLLLKKPDINTKIMNNYGLKKACEYGHINIVKYLIELPEYSEDDLYADNNYCFYHSLKNGHVEISKYIYFLAPSCTINVDFTSVIIGLIFEQSISGIQFCLSELNILIDSLDRKKIVKNAFAYGSSDILYFIMNNIANNDVSIISLPENKDAIVDVFYNLNDKTKMFITKYNLNLKHIGGDDLINHYALLGDVENVNFLYNTVNCQSNFDIIRLFNIAREDNNMQLLEWLHETVPEKIVERKDEIAGSLENIPNEEFRIWLLNNYNEAFSSLLS